MTATLPLRSVLTAMTGGIVLVDIDQQVEFVMVYTFFNLFFFFAEQNICIYLEDVFKCMDNIKFKGHVYNIRISFSKLTAKI